MNAQQKQKLVEALNFVYTISTKAPVEKQAHDASLEAATMLMKHVESIEVKPIAEEKKEGLKKVK